MTLIFELVISLLAAFGLVCLGWLAFGHMVLPVGSGETAVRAEVTARGRGDGLEQAVSGLIWLRRTGLWRGEILLTDGGLDADGRELVARLAEQPGVTVNLPEQVDECEDRQDGRTKPQLY